MNDISTEELWAEIKKVSNAAISLRNTRSHLSGPWNKSARIRVSIALRTQEKQHRALRAELIKRGEIKE